MVSFQYISSDSSYNNLYNTIWQYDYSNGTRLIQPNSLVIFCFIYGHSKLMIFIFNETDALPLPLWLPSPIVLLCFFFSSSLEILLSHLLFIQDGLACWTYRPLCLW